MLKEISIRGYKLIDNVSIEFGEGFNVITGETGAGKSQLLGAVTYGLGARASGDEVSSRADECAVEVTLEIADGRARRVLEKAGLIEEHEDEVILRRVQSSTGRASAWLNGRKVPLSVLRDVADELIEMLGQFERSRLLKADALDILDELGDDKHQALLEEVAASYKKLHALRGEYASRREEVDRLAERRELMKYQYDELHTAGLEDGEESKLEAEHKVLSAAASLIENASKVTSLLYEAPEGGSCAYDLASASLGLLRQMAESDSELKPDLETLENAAELIAEVGRRLSDYAERVQVDEDRLVEVDARLRLIHELKRKHSTNYDGLLAKRDDLGASLKRLDDAGQDLSGIQKEIGSEEKHLLELCGKLTTSRQKIGKLMEKEVVRHLKDLELGNARFAMELRPRDGGPGEHGADQGQLLLSTNPSEELKPLRKIASGGELSRILLALKAHLAGRDSAPILVFDEADVGIGGENAFKVGKKLKELARDHQLILISHLPQVAGMAAKHFRVTKKTNAKGNIEGVEVESLGKVERIDELARMLGASADEKASRKLAKGMLDPD